MRRVSPCLGPEYDTDPPRDPVLPVRAYVVCSTPRSGSGLLCRALTATGVAGTPAEYFNPLTRGPLTRRWGCHPSLASYAAALRARRTDSGGVFGTKLHWDQLETVRTESVGEPVGGSEHDLSAQFLEELFPSASYVRIVRRDLDRQAISLWRATQSGVWSEAAGPSGRPAPPVRYSFSGIERCRALLADGERHWDRFFRIHEMRPFELAYEDLVSEYEGTLASVLRRVVPEAGGVRIPPPVSRRQRNRLSEEMLARLEEDRGRPRVHRIARAAARALDRALP